MAFIHKSHLRTSREYYFSFVANASEADASYVATCTIAIVDKLLNCNQ